MTKPRLLAYVALTTALLGGYAFYRSPSPAPSVEASAGASGPRGAEDLAAAPTAAAPTPEASAPAPMQQPTTKTAAVAPRGSEDLGEAPKTIGDGRPPEAPPERPTIHRGDFVNTSANKSCTLRVVGMPGDKHFNSYSGDYLDNVRRQRQAVFAARDPADRQWVPAARMFERHPDGTGYYVLDYINGYDVGGVLKDRAGQPTSSLERRGEPIALAEILLMQPRSRFDFERFKLPELKFMYGEPKLTGYLLMPDDRTGSFEGAAERKVVAGGFQMDWKVFQSADLEICRPFEKPEPPSDFDIDRGDVVSLDGGSCNLRAIAFGTDPFIVNGNGFSSGGTPVSHGGPSAAIKSKPSPMQAYVTRQSAESVRSRMALKTTSYEIKDAFVFDARALEPNATEMPSQIPSSALEYAFWANKKPLTYIVPGGKMLLLPDDRSAPIGSLVDPSKPVFFDATRVKACPGVKQTAAAS